MTGIDCARCHEGLPDVALGVATGDERDEIIAHVADCARCSAELEQLTRTAEMLLLAVPPQEPPAGFETTVLQSFSPAVVRRRPRWPLVVGAAAAVLLAFALGVGVARLRDPGPRDTAAPSTAAPDTSPPVAVMTGGLTSPDGAPVGQVVAHDNPSWLAIALDASAPRGTYTIICDYEAGDSFTAGTMDATTSGPAAWSATVPIPLVDLHRVRLVNTGGGPNLEAPIT